MTNAAINPSPDQAALVRNAQEFQRAHDMLVAALVTPELREILLGDDPERDQTMKCMVAAADVLCWALGHLHNTNFEHNLRSIERKFMQQGICMFDYGQLVHPEGETHDEKQ